MSKKPKYPDPLETPLKAPPVIVGSENYEAEKKAYDQELSDRFDLLMKHYAIDPKSAGAWRELAFALAQDHVTGLKPWQPAIDPDRHVRILMRMLYMTRVRGFAEKSAASAVSDVFPDLGDAESIRSIFREQHSRPDLKKLIEFFNQIEKKAGRDAFEDALANAVGSDVKHLQAVKKPQRGRPPKK